jgi:WhiB family redox-sensing transcriptional regulator
MTQAWQAYAACRDHDPELFFPVSDVDPKVTAAKHICGTCPVRETCLRWALDTGQRHGVWGGATENERRAIRRGRPAANPATPPEQPARVA